jgi:metal-dependent amidase/aminoacylase/carboxypeptidase family protein
VAIGLLRQQLRRDDQVHGVVIDGGVAANIIPAHVVGRFMCRSTTAEQLHELRARVDACFRAGALATGAVLEVNELGHPFSHMVSDPDLLAHYRAAAEGLGRRFDPDDGPGPAPTISTDMANVSLVIPTIHPLWGIPTSGAVNHQPGFAAACVTSDADVAVIEGALALAATGVAVAQDSALRARLLSPS